VLNEQIIVKEPKEYAWSADFQLWRRTSKHVQPLDLISREDADNESWLFVKAKAKHNYRKLAKQYHPDHLRHNPRVNRSLAGHKGKRKFGYSFRELARVYKKLMALRAMPLTANNMISVLEVTKGYKSNNDTELPSYY